MKTQIDPSAELVTAIDEYAELKVKSGINFAEYDKLVEMAKREAISEDDLDEAVSHAWLRLKLAKRKAAV